MEGGREGGREREGGEWEGRREGEWEGGSPHLQVRYVLKDKGIGDSNLPPNFLVHGSNVRLVNCTEWGDHMGIT